jgi:hypothetical protein
VNPELWKRVIWYGFFLILAAIVVTLSSQMNVMVEKRKHGSPQGNFEAITSATARYYGEHNGQWPESLEMLAPQYLKAIPEDGVTGSRKVVASYDGSGGWVYDKLTGKISSNILTVTPTPTPP